jgi:hypothetical protein
VPLSGGVRPYGGEFVVGSAIAHVRPETKMLTQESALRRA